MKKLLDFSAARPSGASIKKVANGVIRYLSNSSWKNLTAAEVKDYLANGLEIGVIWETTANRCLSGFSGGKADATEALKQSKALLPAIIPIYFAVDFNIAENQLTTLDEYLNGAESVLGKDYVGVYGSYLVVEHCFAKGSAKWFWQTLAWSSGKISAHNHIYQDGKTPPIANTDTNVAVDDWGYRPISTDEIYPSGVLDLKNWKLTLPIGNPTEIKQPQLETFIDKNYFHADGEGVVFRAPVNGATTSGSGYPRSELREMNGKDLASWDTTKGKHSMKISQAILAVPKKKKHIVVGQIHDASDDIIVIRLEDRKLFVDVDGVTIKVLNKNYRFGETFGIEFVAENGKIKVYYNGVLSYTLDEAISGCYFKAGCYTQSNCSKEDECFENNYGESIIYDLRVTHTESTPVPPEKFLIHPLDQVYITQGFGENPAMYKKYGMKGHNGIDYRTRFWDSPLGKRYVMAAKDGKVIELGNEGTGGYGIFVRLEHDLNGSGNEQTIYAHLKKWYVGKGQYVRQGHLIGLTDNTGASTGPHLHWGYRPKGWKKIYDNGFKGYIDQKSLII